MKIRNGFVSNSSSSSFVIGKYFMTQEQIDEFHNLNHQFDVLRDSDDSILSIEFMEYFIEFDDDTCIYEDDNYFYGQIGDMHYDTMVQFMRKHKLDNKYSVMV